jgi:hypothetical protein
MQYDGINWQIFKSEYRNGSWTYPSGLTDNMSPDGQDAMGSQVSMDDNGNTVITWMQYDGSNWQIFKSEYRNGSWTYPSGLTDAINPDGQDAGYPQVSMDDNGNAIITWEQYDGNNWQIFKSEYRNGSWTYPSDLTDNISPDGQDAGYPQVATSDNGNAIITWYQSRPNGSDQIYESNYRNGGWDNPIGFAGTISVGTGLDAAFPQVAMDNNGDVIITWNQIDFSGISRILKNEYR